MDQKKKYPLKEFFDFKEVFEYFFRRKGSYNKPDFNLHVMHGVNKISIIIFLIAVIILTIRYFMWK